MHPARTYDFRERLCSSYLSTGTYGRTGRDLVINKQLDLTHPDLHLSNLGKHHRLTSTLANPIPMRAGPLLGQSAAKY